MIKCSAIDVNGQRCGGRAIDGSQWCWGTTTPRMPRYAGATPRGVAGAVGPARWGGAGGLLRVGRIAAATPLASCPAVRSGGARLFGVAGDTTELTR
jgi:hypothetical protein